MKAISQYISALEELKNATTSGKIDWIRDDPNTYSYKTMNEDLEDEIITFTRAEIDFKLTLDKKDFESTKSIMNLDTSSFDFELREYLADLFETIEYHVDLKNLEGLNNFVELVTSNEKRQTILD